jgi:hypothetical protein
MEKTPLLNEGHNGGYINRSGLKSGEMETRTLSSRGGESIINIKGNNTDSEAFHPDGLTTHEANRR